MHFQYKVKHTSVNFKISLKSSESFIKQFDKIIFNILEMHVQIDNRSSSNLKCNSLNQEFRGSESRLIDPNKNYSKSEFTLILRQLSDENPLYYCQKHQLQLIYDKVIQNKGQLSYYDLAEFTQALEQKNKENFEKQIEIYKNYICTVQNQGKKYIKSKDLLTYLDKCQYMGYLSDSLFAFLNKDQQISLKKLQNCLQNIENDFKNKGQVSMPKRLSLKRSVYGQDLQQQYIFEVVQRGKINVRNIQNLKQQILANLKDQTLAIRVQKQFQEIEEVILQINENTIPQLKQQVSSLKKYNKQISQQTRNIYEQLDQKSNEAIRDKNQILQLNQKIRSLFKQLVQTKIQLNSREQECCQIIVQKNQLQDKLRIQKSQTKMFFDEYKSLRNQYEGFLTSLKQKQDQERATKDQQNNLFPALSLKQQLEDAQFKIKKLKQQKLRLLEDLQNNENGYFARIQTLEKQLSQARNEANRTQHLKMTGMSRLSNNFQTFGNTRAIRNSMSSSVVSVLRQSTRHRQNRMTLYIQQVEQSMKQSKREAFGGPSSYDKNKSYIGKPAEESGHFEGKLQASFYKQAGKDQPKYNFCDLNYQELKKRIAIQHPIIDTQGDQSKISESNKEDLRKQASSLQDYPSLQYNPGLYHNPGLQQKPNNGQTKWQTLFICPAQIVSKSGTKYKKNILFNRKGIFIFDTKLRPERQIGYQKVLKIAFTYYNLDCFVISFKRQESPMKEKTTNAQCDIVLKCPRTKQLITFLSQPIFRLKLFREARLQITVQKQSEICIIESAERDVVLSNCGNFYNPFKINLSLKNYHNNMFYAELSRQAIFSRSFIIICIVEEFGIYCFEWDQDQMLKQKKFIYLLPLVKRMIFIREEMSFMVKLIYQDWSDGKTFLLRFKNHKESLKFQIVCKQKLKVNLGVLQSRKEAIQNAFKP